MGKEGNDKYKMTEDDYKEASEYATDLYYPTSEDVEMKN